MHPEPEPLRPELAASRPMFDEWEYACLQSLARAQTTGLPVSFEIPSSHNGAIGHE
jgi:hypothetical protein